MKIDRSVLISPHSWKVRYLIRIHELLSYIDRMNSSDSSEKGKAKAAEEIEETIPIDSNIEEFQKRRTKFQMKRIKKSVEKIVRYLAKALLEPGLPTKANTYIMPDHHVAGESNYYYVMMTIWYVWKYFNNADRDWTFDWVDQLRENKGCPILLGPHRLPPDDWTFAAADRDKVQLLRWYHYGSLLNLCQKGVLDGSWQDREPGLAQKVLRLANAAKMVSSAKLSSRDPYVADDEIFDRLSFVSDELSLEKLKDTDPGVVSSLSMKRVRGRDFTRVLNPGWVPKTEEASISGPWEIHALCHHSRLVVLMKEEKTEQDWRTKEHTHSEAEGFRKDICAFLNEEGTLIPCWERAHDKYRKGWLRSEATSVVATTLVIILYKTRQLAEKLAADAEKASTGDGLSPKSPTDRAKPEFPPVEQTLANWSKYSQKHEKRLIQEILHLGGVMKGQLDAFERFTNESSLQRPIVWKSFRPPRTYHPLMFFNSLEDTPEMYKYTVLGDKQLPLSLPGGDTGVLDRPEDLKSKCRDFRKKDIEEVFEDLDTQNLLFLFDIKATRKIEDDEGFTWEIEPYMYDEKNVKESKENFVWELYDNVS